MVELAVLFFILVDFVSPPDRGYDGLTFKLDVKRFNRFFEIAL